MHVEKNVCVNLVGTLLDIEKTKDNFDARKNLQKMYVGMHYAQ